MYTFERFGEVVGLIVGLGFNVVLIDSVWQQPRYMLAADLAE
jgi:hypothetical protein